MTTALTGRLGQILELLGEALTNKEIGSRLGLTEGTVKVYVHRLRRAHPDIGTRHGAVKLLARQHARNQALRLDAWIKKNEIDLRTEALVEIRQILAEQVAEVIR